jgi:hypothetical protein
LAIIAASTVAAFSPAASTWLKGERSDVMRWV